jgi:hypothetical protein
MRRWRREAGLWAVRHGRVPGPGFESRLVWMFGSPRSGSTWLLRLLAEHPAVVPVDEPLIGNYLGPFMCDLPGVKPEDLDLGNFTLTRMRREAGPQFFSDEARDVWPQLLGRFIKGRIWAEALKDPTAPARGTFVIKEPNGSQAADMIMASLPRSSLLFLLRDGRDVVDSDLAANLEGSWASEQFSGFRGIPEEDRLDFVTRSAYKWLWRTEVVQSAFAAHPGPKHLIRYEDLRREPASATRVLFDWLRLPLDDAELSALVERHSFDRIPAQQRGPQAFFRAANPGQWSQSLTPEEQSAMTRVIGSKLRELGYD